MHSNNKNPCSLKLTRTNEISYSDLCKFPHQNFNKNIKPIIRVYNSILLNNPKRRLKLPQLGIKNFSKLTATGESTLSSLQNIKKSSKTLKHISKFEFDPFLCDFSCLKTLCKVLHKLKYIRTLTLVIPRVDRLNETNLLGPYVYKLPKMTKITVKLPNTQNIDHQGISKFGEMFGKCLSLTSLTYAFINLPTLTEKNSSFHKAHRKLFKVEDMNISVSYSEAELEGDVYKDSESGSFRVCKLKRLSMAMRIKNGWTSMGENPLPEQFLKILILAVDMREMTIKTHGFSLNSEAGLCFFKALTQMPNLRSLHLEHFNCNISDAEIMAVVYGLTQLPQLETFTFKNIQHPNVPESCIIPMAKVLSQLNHLKNIDIYLRRLSIPEEAAQKLVSQLSFIENIKTCYFRGSLHLYRHSSS